jgi:glucokinase
MQTLPSPVVGIDLGGTKILAAVVDGQGQVISRHKLKTVPAPGQKSTPDVIVPRLVTAVEKAVAKAGLSLNDIVAIGTSAPGTVDITNGRVHRTANLWDQSFDLGPVLAERLGRPVFVDNDVNLGTLGEAVYGAARGKADVIGVFIGTGIGGGIILNGELRHGARNAAAEIGHVAMRRKGPRCGCGIRGHIEALASRGAISRRLEKAVRKGKAPVLAEILAQRNDPRITSGVIRRALEAGDKKTVRVIAEAQEHLGVFLASLVNILDPECIVMGGGLVESLGEPFLAPIRKIAYAHFFQSEDAERVEIVAAALGDDAGVLGAAVWAQRRLQLA